MDKIKYYLCKKYRDNISITEIENISITEMKKIDDIPRYREIINNNAISYSDPREAKEFYDFLSSQEDGIYIASFDCIFFDKGWAQGWNWYGDALYQA